MGRIFISYSTKDLDLCEEFKSHASALTAGRGFHLWRDRDDIGPGGDWKQALFDAVDRADVLVALVTADWAASKWCQWE